MKQMFIKVQIFAIVVMGFWSSLVLIVNGAQLDMIEHMGLCGYFGLLDWHHTDTHHITETHSPGLIKNPPYPFKVWYKNPLLITKKKYGRISHTWPASHHALFLAVRVTSWEPQLVGWRACRKPLDALLPLCPLTCP